MGRASGVVTTPGEVVTTGAGGVVVSGLSFVAAGGGVALVGLDVVLAGTSTGAGVEVCVSSAGVVAGVVVMYAGSFGVRLTLGAPGSGVVSTSWCTTLLVPGVSWAFWW